MLSLYFPPLPFLLNNENLLEDMDSQVCRHHHLIHKQYMMLSLHYMKTKLQSLLLL